MQHKLQFIQSQIQALVGFEQEEEILKVLKLVVDNRLQSLHDARKQESTRKVKPNAR